jgi:hypothetical protein
VCRSEVVVAGDRSPRGLGQHADHLLGETGDHMLETWMMIHTECSANCGNAVLGGGLCTSTEHAISAGQIDDTHRWLTECRGEQQRTTRRVAHTTVVAGQRERVTHHRGKRCDDIVHFLCTQVELAWEVGGG